MRSQRKNTRERGIAVIMCGAMLIFMTLTVGLAVDVGTLYMVKARLSSAADAAALAAGRSVNLADTVANANIQATTTALNFFHANFPDGYMATLGTPTVAAHFNTESDSFGNYNGILDIKVDASVRAPTYFMNLINISNVMVATTGTASRRGLVMMLVLDISTSMNTPSTPTACQIMKDSARNFIKNFSPYDRVGLVAFESTANLSYAPTSSFGNGTLDTTIANLSCFNNTNTTSALELAYQQIVAQGLPLAQNSIVLFTDGSPNGISADFPLRTVVDTRWGPVATTTGAPTPPTQPTGYNCTNTSNNGSMCQNMPTICPTPGFVRGTLTQTAGQNPNGGGGSGGLYKPMSTDPAVSLPASTPSQPCGQTGSTTRQMIAYIPDTDIYGNSTHGVVATANTGTATGGMVTRDNWLFQTNSGCDSNNVCKFMGDFWSLHSSVGSGSNFFPAGSPYAGKLRNDQPNSICAASMNTAMAEAYKIRSDSTYHVVINTIYLTGNFGDAVDREFLPIIANVQTVPPLPYQPTSTPSYGNPAFQPHQEHGQYLVTNNANDLPSLFQQLASQVLRLSN